ncbi:hypothetical protein GCM10023063_22000 [Arthrobacter methylotrophus]
MAGYGLSDVLGAPVKRVTGHRVEPTPDAPASALSSTMSQICLLIQSLTRTGSIALSHGSATVGRTIGFLGGRMEFAEKLSALAAKVRQQRGGIQTEEAPMNAFVMPFISTILGYDAFNPMEVVPEFIADVGLKKGEKVDHAIVKDGEIQILIECKKSTEPVKIEHASQLFRYFAVTNARIAILTNGEIYQFFTDLDAPNKMDAKPFLVLDVNDIDDSLIPELQKLSKDVFDLDSIISAAGELKYIGEIKRTLAAQFHEPEDEWVKFLTARVYSGAYTQRCANSSPHW